MQAKSGILRGFHPCTVANRPNIAASQSALRNYCADALIFSAGDEIELSPKNVNTLFQDFFDKYWRRPDKDCFPAQIVSPHKDACIGATFGPR
jgi:hypothetical protein